MDCIHPFFLLNLGQFFGTIIVSNSLTFSLQLYLTYKSCYIHSSLSESNPHSVY